MPTNARCVRREHVESSIALRRATVEAQVNAWADLQVRTGDQKHSETQVCPSPSSSLKHFVREMRDTTRSCPPTRDPTARGQRSGPTGVHLRADDSGPPVRPGASF